MVDNNSFGHWGDVYKLSEEENCIMKSLYLRFVYCINRLNYSLFWFLSMILIIYTITTLFWKFRQLNFKPLGMKPFAFKQISTTQIWDDVFIVHFRIVTLFTHSDIFASTQSRQRFNREKNWLKSYENIDTAYLALTPFKKRVTIPSYSMIA